MTKKVTPEDVRKLVKELEDKKLIDLNITLKQVLELDSLSEMSALTDPTVELRWYIAGGSHFVLVCEN